MDKEEFEFPDEKEAKANEVEIEIVDDTPEVDRGKSAMAAPVDEVTDEELASYDEKVQKRIKKFTKGYHDERRAKEEAFREREAAEGFARSIFQENKRLQSQLANGSNAYIEQSKSAATQELEAVKKRYKEAYESADSDAMVQAQADIAKATLRLDKAENMRPVQVEEREMPVAQQQQAQPQKSAVNPRTQEWVDANNEWFGAPGFEDMTMMAMGLDKKLQREYGADYIGSEKYFKNIDTTMRKRFPEHFGSQPDEEETPRRASRPASVVAPATRSTPPNRIRLKASEAAIARRLGVPLELYAKQVAKLNTSGV